jgi:Protein of unknown function (DUF2637)
LPDGCPKDRPLIRPRLARCPELTSTPSSLPADQRRAAARDAYRASLAEGVPLTGADLGRQFGLSPRWGRNRVAEVHAEATAAPNGSRPTARHAHETIALDDDPTSRTHRPDARQPDDADRGADSASARSNGSAPPWTGRAASARLTSDEARSAVTPTVRRITTLAVLAVALVAAIASYDHQRALAELAGEGWRAWLLPVSVDGLVVAASMSMLVRRRVGLPAGALAWASLLAGIGASLAANVAAADPTAVGRVVAAWPPVALLLAWELLMHVRAPTSTAAMCR